MLRASLFVWLALLGRMQPSQDGADLMTTYCTVCHGPSLIAQQRLDRNGWTRELDKMLLWGARLPENQKATLIDYLARTFQPSRPAGNTARYLPDGAGNEVVRTACLSCHDDRALAQRRRTRNDWVRIVDRMIAWGAPVPAERTGELIDYLTAHFNP